MARKQKCRLTTSSVLIALFLYAFVGDVAYHVLTLETKDSVVATKDTPVVVNKTALFIGDSHTANHQFGWQVQLCKQTGVKYKNVSVSGKSTGWMVLMAKQHLYKGLGYCFIYGGANDMWGGIEPRVAFDNIQYMVELCAAKGVKAVVLTGFDAKKVTKTNNLGYPERYSRFQKLLLDSLKGATVVDTRVIDRGDCWDGLCHMNYGGHKKIAEKIIKDLEFKKI